MLASHVCAAVSGRQSTIGGPVTGFHRDHGVLTCDGLSVADLARTAGTPGHLYSGALIAERLQALRAAFAGEHAHIHYAIKANATLGIVRLLRRLGARADANSGGEMEVALRAGYAPSEIVFTGVGKTAAELERAVSLGLHAINAESSGEVERIAAIARTLGTRARIALRINPDVDAGTHHHISTGSAVTKFGVTVEQARAMARAMAGRHELQLIGLHVHIGSQITKPQPLTEAAQTIADLAREFMAQGHPLEHLDVGGGLGIAYRAGQPVMTPAEYAAAVLPPVRATGLSLVLEPGRWIVGPAGIIVTEIVDLKPQPGGRWFVIVDAGMTDLIRPALYSAWHNIEAVSPRKGPPIICDIVGPVCETSDTLGSERELSPVMVGDLLVVRDTGAYGSVMASNYNRRPFAAELMVDEGSPRLIRRRQTIDDMLQWDV